MAKTVFGTWSNCGSGRTPWGTYLACEENFNLSFGSADKSYKSTEEQKRYRLRKKSKDTNFYTIDERYDISKQPNEANRFGYVVEIDPSDPLSKPKKRTALGRFMHENAEVVLNHDGRVVVYMGDDARGEYLYKFVSDGVYQPNSWSMNSKLLDEGKLYVAKFGKANKRLAGKGKWIELKYGEHGLMEANGFASQAEICVHTRQAASHVQATSMDRPEWVAAHPHKAEVYCALTNNNKREINDLKSIEGPNPRAKNLYGQIVRWRPKNGDHTSTEFKWDLFVLAGNPVAHKRRSLYAGSRNINRDNMFNSPDGLAFDKNGILWIQTDGKYTNEGDYEGMGNNQMLLGDPGTGEIVRFLVGPVGSEVTGLTWAPDYKTMFVGIQHPGERETPSHFPYGGNSVPRSTVIAIKRNDGAEILG